MAQGQSADRPAGYLQPQLVSGLELIYRGTCIEEALVPGVQYQRQYLVENILFVHDVQPQHFDVAVQTSLFPASSKFDKKEPAPASARLELARIDRNGRVRAGDVRLPLDGLPTLDAGAILEAPLTRVGANEFWEVNEDNRPPRTWMVVGSESSNGLTCVKIVGQQQSDDWDLPRADRTAWRRKDVLFFAQTLGLVVKVERTVERREPARRDPTQSVKVVYELDSRLRYPGKLFDDRKQEIAMYRRYLEEATPYLSQPASYRGQIEVLQKKIAQHSDAAPPTPYRKALVHLAGRLEAARLGELPPAVAKDEPRLVQGPVGVGQRVPDFVVSSLTGDPSARLYRQLGRPVLILYYNPASSVSREVLGYARDLAQRHPNHVGILAMAVTQDVDFVRKQHADLRLPFAILDGKGMHHTFGVDATPRVILLDGDAVVRTAFTGWGVHSPGEIREELQRLLPK